MEQKAITQLERSARRILADFERVIGDLSQAGEQQAGAVATRLHNGADTARDRLIDLEEGAVMRARSLGRHARTYARHHPWATGGIALAAAAITFGLLAWRRQR